MLVEQAIRQLLLNDAGVSAIVSGRIFPQVLPQSVTYPAVAYRMVTRKAGNPVMGARVVGPPKAHYWIVSAHRGTGTAVYQTVKLLDEAIRLCLQGYSGTVTLTGSSPAESIYIQGIFLVDGADEPYNDATQTQQVGSLFAAWHSQPQP